MASKRYSQSAGPVVLKKLPRLAPAPSCLPGKIPGTSSPVPHPGSGNHFSYKGSYFACPLQSPEGPEQPPAGWSPTPTYLHYGPGALSQPVPAEGPLLGLLLYPPESLSTRLQPPDTQKSKDSLSQEQLMVRKKLDSPRCPLPVKKPVVVKKAAPLAVPKPVYGAPASFLAPRMALLLGAQAESLQQRPGEAHWALPPATHPLHPSEPHRTAPGADHSLLPLPSSLALPSREQLSSPAALPHYCLTFDKYGPLPSTPFLEASCSSAQSQKKVPEVPSLSLEPWPKLQPPDSSPVIQERSAMCFPPPPYPLSLHRSGPLYHPTAPNVGEPSALPSFGYVGSREPFPSAYLKPQEPRSYFPSPLEPYVPRAVGARDAELPEEEKVLVVKKVGIPSGTPSGQYFSSLHTLLCDTISGSVSRSSPELLRQWLKKAELAEELGEMPKSLTSPKDGSKAPNAQKPSNGKEIWLAFQDVAALLTKLLSQLRTFMSACPFPHVVRAGAIFIPIHVVKEKLFPKLPGSFVDQVLQKHKVELRPTTLSEERHLRELELKSCTSRMLKLLAIKWLPEIYPDLLNLHWHSSIQQQLGSPGLEALVAKQQPQRDQGKGGTEECAKGNSQTMTAMGRS
nr:uncharacterized protein C15orf39 homolog [Zonotrichia albicollis]